MKAELLAELPLVCPHCRHQGMPSVLRLQTLRVDEQQQVHEGWLDCPHGCRYPIVAGVPVVVRDMADWWQQSRHHFTALRSDHPTLTAYFSGLDAHNSQQQTERGLLSTYMDAHYGSLTPQASLPDNTAYWQSLIRLTATAVNGGIALDLGCGVGRFSFELAQYHDRVIGVDLNFQLVATAARIQRTQQIDYERRLRGRQFTRITQPWPVQNTHIGFMVADALDPPFTAEYFDTVAALNLLDNVTIPLLLLGQMDALLRSGGTLLLASPYEWRTDISEAAQWLESADYDAATVLRQILSAKLIPQLPLDYHIIQEEAELPWVLRQHSRFWQQFLVHWLAARKG